MMIVTTTAMTISPMMIFFIDNPSFLIRSASESSRRGAAA